MFKKIMCLSLIIILAVSSIGVCSAFYPAEFDYPFSVKFNNQGNEIFINDVLVLDDNDNVLFKEKYDLAAGKDKTILIPKEIMRKAKRLAIYGGCYGFCYGFYAAHVIDLTKSWKNNNLGISNKPSMTFTCDLKKEIFFFSGNSYTVKAKAQFFADRELKYIINYMVI